MNNNKGVLAVRLDGSLSICTASPEERGKGRCNHISHQKPDESVEDFVKRVSNLIYSSNDVTTEDLIRNIIEENKMSFNDNPEWDKIIDSDKISKYFSLGDDHATGNCEVIEETNEFGDPVDHLILHVNFKGEEVTGDFGCVPHVDDRGIIQINGTEYRCLPVMGRNKVGYGQGEMADGRRMIFVYQENGDPCFVIDCNSRMVTFDRGSKKYTIEEFEDHLANKDNDFINTRLNYIDHHMYERNPEFGTKGNIDNMISNFKKDEIDDLENRRVYTYKDIVEEELYSQLTRMGVTFRQNYIKDGSLVVFQKNNTSNIASNLQGRSNVQMAENTNPLASYSQSHKITLVGRGGFNKETITDALRYPSDSYRGITEPLDQSSGKGVGFNVFLKNCDVVDGVIKKSNNTDQRSLTDFVPYCYHNNPNRVSMACSQMRQALPLIHGEDPLECGDTKCDSSWAKISGAKMGLNLRMAYLPDGNTWEDACIISESAAKKMSTIKKFKFGNDDKFKDGQFVEKGTIIGGKETQYDGNIRKTDNGFDMEVEVPMLVDDKIANRTGNKSIVSKILSDDKMPKILNKETGRYVPAEVCISPLSIGKRGNIGGIMEINRKPTLDTELDNIVLNDGHTVKSNSGTQFFMRLDQISGEKLHFNGGEQDNNRELAARFGQMEQILLTTTEERRQVLNYLKSKTNNESERLEQLMHAIGVTFKKK